jgi:hypothetical protein
MQPDVGHRLAAAGLLFGILDLESLLLEQLQSSQTHPWVELIDVTGNKQANAHSPIVGRTILSVTRILAE